MAPPIENEPDLLPQNLYGESRLWKWLFCRWFHEEHRCFPEVWGRGLDGPWHCAKCHPCSEDFLKLLDQSTKELQ